MTQLVHIDDPVAFCCLAREEERLTALQYAQLRQQLKQDPASNLADFVLREGWLGISQVNYLAEKSNGCANVSSRIEAKLREERTGKNPAYDSDSTMCGKPDIEKSSDELIIFTEPAADFDPAEISGQNYTDNYVIRRELGRGGLGRVLLAHDRSLGREVAIKEMLTPPSSEKYPFALARFLNEAKVTGQLQHPGIIPVHEMGARPDGTFYYVMKYISGHSLRNKIKAAHHEAAELAADALHDFIDRLILVCAALDFAHAKGFIHRDLKTDNVIIGAFNETLVLDWGLAKSAAESNEQNIKDIAAIGEIGISDDLTLDGEILGTPAYMSPEQMDPSFGELDTRSDVYALGVILFEILTGETPYARAGTLRNLARQLTSIDQTPSPAAVKRDLPPELVAICNTALAKNKSLRYQSAAELAAALKAFRRGEMIPGVHYTRRQRLGRVLRKNAYALAASALIFTSLVFGAFIAHNLTVVLNGR